MATRTTRTRRLRPAPWSRYTAVTVALVAAVVGCGCAVSPVDAAPLVRGALGHEDHTAQDEDVVLPSAAAAALADSNDAFPWRRVTQYEFETDEPARMVSFCTAKPSVRAMVFAMLPINSTAKDQLERASREASRLANAFDTSQVTRRDVSKDTPVQLTSASNGTQDAVLYRARFGAATAPSSSSATRCVDAVLSVTGAGMFVLFAEHAETNVTISIIDALQREVHYTSCLTGCDAPKVGESLSDEDAEEKVRGKATSSAAGASDWSSPVVASIAIALVSLLGVLALSLGKKHVDVVVDYMMSFAAGCLLAVTVFHLYPEGSGYVADLGEWVAGACVIGGLALSMAFEQTLHLLLDAFGAQACKHSAAGRGGGHAVDGEDHMHDLDKFQQKNEFDMLESVTSRTSQHVTVLLQSLSSTAMAPHRRLQAPLHFSQSIAVLGPNDRGSGASDDAPSDPPTWRDKYVSSLRRVAPIAWVTALGDFFHAFTDGVVLAVAFKSCSSSLGWAVALGVVLHEVPHRVGDHFIFLKAGMRVSQALALNFVASLASLLAVVVVLSVGSVSEHTLGVLLCVGAGALLFIALVKLLPPMLDVRQGGRAFLHFLCFAVGCAVIGVSMLQHAHCEVAGGADAAHAH